MVIKDAMKLTADIGQRYLWVDSLCIVQDGPEKMDTINQMELVATAGSRYRPVLQARDRDPLHQNQVKRQKTISYERTRRPIINSRIIHSFGWKRNSTKAGSYSDAAIS
jgi:hypothetical protein